VHFDRCTSHSKTLFTSHPLCLGSTHQDSPHKEFTEQHKQSVFDLVVKAGFRWAMALDIDETYMTKAPAIIHDICKSSYDCVDIRWLNLWEDQYHVRIDEPWGTGHRVKFYNLRAGKWSFAHPVVNGARLPGKASLGRRHDLVCLHWGLMTHTLRSQHKARWDRIYTAAVGANPYGAWNYIMDPTVTPEVVKHDY
jgi:hypothetical protein